MRQRLSLVAAFAVLAASALTGCARTVRETVPAATLAPQTWEYYGSRELQFVERFINERHPRADGVQVAISDTGSVMHAWVRTGDNATGTWRLLSRPFGNGADAPAWARNLQAFPGQYVAIGVRGDQFYYLERR